MENHIVKEPEKQLFTFQADLIAITNLKSLFKFIGYTHKQSTHPTFNTAGWVKQESGNRLIRVYFFVLDNQQSIFHRFFNS